MRDRPGETRQLASLRQTRFDFGEEPPPIEAPRPAVQFQKGDRGNLVLGREPLDVYLRRTGQGWIADFAELVDQLDMQELIAAYPGGGRPPIHPRIPLGLILYGLSLGVTSLRELERLAVVDVGAWWICRGIQPDFTTLCRFVLRHVERLGEAFFADVTHTLCRELGIKATEVAGDGTVVQSAASRFGAMTAEAAQERANELSARAKLDGDARTRRAAEAMETVAEVASERGQARSAKGKDGATVKVAPSDPDAMVQKQKDGTTRPSYKPSIIATPERLVVALYVHASSETAAIAPMFDQCEAVLGQPLPTTMLDAGYFSQQTLLLAVERELDLLCPSGSLDKTGNAIKGSRSGKLAKSDFRYDGARDVYQCPAGATLVPFGKGCDRHGMRYVGYRAPAATCAQCPLRARCTKARRGRTVRRYPIDDIKNDMHAVMRHPSAKARYRRRQGIVEPVFAELQRQGLRRFRRRGLRKVRVEFCLHAVAYNLRRAVRLQFLAVCARVDGGPWRPVWLAIRAVP